MPRKHGFEGPYTRVNVGAWVGQLSGVALMFVLLGMMLAADVSGAGTLLGVYGALLAAAGSCWVYCQGVDPGQPGGTPLPCFKQEENIARYCSVCRKQVPGMDHHCMWLNTCVGTRTYRPFYALALFGWLTFGWQALVGVWAVADKGSREALKAKFGTGALATAVALSSLFGVIIFTSYFTLWVYHTYLLKVGEGTYTRMISNYAAKAAAQREARLKAKPKAEAKADASETDMAMAIKAKEPIANGGAGDSNPEEVRA